MKAATIHEIKQELSAVKPAEIIELCLRLARFKKENKELLTYLLFEANDEKEYINSIKKEIDDLFETINLSHLYFAKKTLRKIVRVINKYCRYSSNKQTETDLRIYFCQKLKASGIPFHRNTVISNLFESQLKKINSVLATLHDDLQYDYLRELKPLMEGEEKKVWSIFKRR
ncbi:MAG TPA: hypothetical protein VKC90_09185 [Chitinophagaceae bacterium]|nr:hypothetical protein [Chitinophagaceae bacterium]